MGASTPTLVGQAVVGAYELGVGVGAKELGSVVGAYDDGPAEG